MVSHRALFVLLLVAACSKGSDQSPGAGKVASCNMPTMQTCREYRDANLALGVEHVAKICGIGNGKLTETPCPTEGVIGVCAMNEGTDFYYTGFAIPQPELESSCKSSGGKYRAK